MSEWIEVVAVFWILWLADGLAGGRRDKLRLFAWRGSARSPRARLAQSSWFLPPPSPAGWSLSLEDAPVSISAEGVVNRPAGAAARPAYSPERLVGAAWSEIEKIEARGGWICVNGRRLAPETASLDARGLRGLADRLRGRDAVARTAIIARWQERRFSFTRARRRMRVALGRTAWLARYNTLQTAGWAALSVALLAGWFAPAAALGRALSTRDAQMAAAANAPWWGLLAWLGVLHALALVEAWRAHRRLHPARGDERASMIFSALLLPAQALRLRATLLRPLAREFAPLPLILAAGSSETAREAARATLGDLLHPARPASLPPEAARLVEAASALVLPAVERALDGARSAGAEGLAREELFAPPTGCAAGVCAWCPRCGDTFVRADGACPQGVPLRPL